MKLDGGKIGSTYLSLNISQFDSFIARMLDGKYQQAVDTQTQSISPWDSVRNRYTN
jgi:hypothetical protein